MASMEARVTQSLTAYVSSKVELKLRVVKVGMTFSPRYPRSVVQNTALFST